MKVYTCTYHDGHYPVGVASVIVANNLTEAHDLLDDELEKFGLKPWIESNYRLWAVDLTKPNAEILNDGNY